MNMRLHLLVPIVAMVGSLSVHSSELAAVDLKPVNSDSIITHAPQVPDSDSFSYMYFLDKTDIDLNKDYTYTTTYHIIDLALNSEGVDRLGTFRIGYRDGYDSVAIHVARSIDPNGHEFKVPDGQIMWGISPSDLMGNDLYTDRREIRINFPGIQAGSIVELKYTIRRYRQSFEGFSMGFYFDSNVPSRYAQLSVRYPESIKLYSKGYGQPVESEEKKAAGSHIKSWWAHEIHELPSEPGQLPLRDLATRIELSSQSSWEEYAREYYDSLWAPDLAQPLDSGENAVLAQLDLKKKPALQKAKAIYYWIEKQMRYLGLEMGVNNLKPYPSSVICQKRYGDCKDLSNLLVKLLRAEGIDAQPALVSTKLLNNDASFAAVELMDHAIVYIAELGGKQVFLDPTLKYCQFGVNNPDVANHMAVVLGKTPKMIPRIPFSEMAFDVQGGSYFVILDSEGVSHNSTVTSAQGLVGASMKEQFASVTREQAENFIKSEAGASIQVTNVEIRGLDDYDSSFALVMTAVDSNAATIAGNLMILGAAATTISFDNSGGIERRTTDVYLGYKPAFSYLKNIVIPDSYKVNHVPDNVYLSTDQFDYSLEFVITGEKQITIRESANVKEPMIPLAKYPEYRAALAKMAAAEKDKIVLEKR